MLQVLRKMFVTTLQYKSQEDKNNLTVTTLLKS